MANWSISLLEREVSDGGVLVAHWQCSDVDGDYTASAYGSCSFSYDASSSDFVPYDDLTQEIVLEWCWSGDADKSHIEKGIDLQIQEQKTPSIESGLPWS